MLIKIKFDFSCDDDFSVVFSYAESISCTLGYPVCDLGIVTFRVSQSVIVNSGHFGYHQSWWRKQYRAFYAYL